MVLSGTIQLLFDAIGRSDEYRFYLNRFRNNPTGCFALLLPDQESLEQVDAIFLFQLRFLLKLDLYPAIYVNGDTVKHAEEFARLHSELFTLASLDSLESNEKSADIFTKNQKEGRIVIFTSSATNSIDHLSLFAEKLCRRLHFIRLRGAVRNRDEQDIYYCTINESGENISSVDLELFRLASKLFSKHNTLHIAVTSPVDLLKEIFTVKGAGTIFRQRSIIHVYESIHDADKERLQKLIEESFHRTLSDPSLLDRIKRYYIEENYRGALLLEEHPAGLYLSKYAVGTLARGEGVAQDLWQRADQNEKRMFWRSRKENSINRWYAKLSDGLQHTESWTIFWKGIDPEQIPNIIRFCVERPQDFNPPSEKN